MYLLCYIDMERSGILREARDMGKEILRKIFRSKGERKEQGGSRKFGAFIICTLHQTLLGPRNYEGRYERGM
jgi:hypothetical protein